MRRLLILRHAKTEPLLPGGEDHQRPLAARGHQDAAKIGFYLTRHALVPRHALLSSARRVQETWADAAPALKPTPTSVTEPRLYNATPETILAIIRSLAGHPSAMVVAHNPGLHETAMRLIASGDTQARERLAEGLPTAGLVVIDFPVADWSEVAPSGGRLQHFVSPGMLSSATD